MLQYKKALLMVDLQNDFCTGGSLAVPGGEDVIPLANQIQMHFDLVIATQDWHPHDHVSFAVNHADAAVGEVILVDNIPQVLWPEHCVQGTVGAQFHQNLNLNKVAKVFYKGCDKNVDSYSAFFDNEHLRSTGLGDFLHEQGVEDIYVLGLATDYCVKYSVLDAVRLGFNVCVIQDACRGVELKQGDVANAIAEMKAVGAKMVKAVDV